MTEVPYNVREMPAYRAGRKAYPSKKNPFARGDNRAAWWTGHYDERIVIRLGPVFKRNGITYP